MEVYFDNAATSYPKPEAVYEAVEDYMRNVGVNPGRGGYKKALEVEEFIFSVRQALGKLFNISETSRLIFASNVTESLNLAIKGLLTEGDHVITTHLEHNAMWRPLKRAEREKNVKITVIEHDPDTGSLPIRNLEVAIRKDTNLVAINHASNVTGRVVPLAQIGEICQRKNLPLLVDAAQTAGVYPIDVKKMGISLLAFTGHKSLLGPTGTGGLYIAPGIQLEPLKEGGTGSQSQLERQPDHLPDRYEAGTLNVSGLAGLKAGVEFILEKGVVHIRKKEKELTERIIAGLKNLREVDIYGPESFSERVAVVSFNADGLAPGQIASQLDDHFGMLTRAGLHCSPMAHRMLGTENKGALRISPGIFNTPTQVDKLIEALASIVQR